MSISVLPSGQKKNTEEETNNKKHTPWLQWAAGYQKQVWFATGLAYAYRLCLFLGERSERNTANGMSHELWNWVIPEYCAILNNVIISLAYNSFQKLLKFKTDNNFV